MKDNPRIRAIETYSFQGGKLPPQAVDLEELVLGSLLIDKRAINKVIGLLPAESFYKEAHKKIFQSCLNLHHAGDPIDIGTVRAQLSKDGELDFVGGAFYISQLTDKIGSSANIEAYARIILEKHVARELIRVSSDSIELAYEETSDVFDLLAQHSSNSHDLHRLLDEGKSESIESVAQDALEAFNSKVFGKDLMGVKSHYPVLDSAITCFDQGEYICVGARPGMGKTTFMLETVRKNAELGIPCAILSAEMTPQKLMLRLCSLSLKDIPAFKFRETKALKKEEITAIQEELKRLATLPIQIFYAGGWNHLQLKSKMTILAEEGVKFIGIDYVQLFHSDNSRDKANDRITKVSNAINSATKSNNISTMVLSQLNRDVEDRKDKMPMLSDLRESGSIEQDADMVIMLMRPGYYGIEHDRNQEYVGDVYWALIEKFRDGGVQNIQLKWNSKNACPYDPDESDDSQFKVF